MSWDFTVEPEFGELLDWADEFVTGKVYQLGRLYEQTCRTVPGSPPLPGQTRVRRVPRVHGWRWTRVPPVVEETTVGRNRPDQH